jgi:hypothetical protein
MTTQVLRLTEALPLTCMIPFAVERGDKVFASLGTLGEVSVWFL